MRRRVFSCSTYGCDDEAKAGGKGLKCIREAKGLDGKDEGMGEELKCTVCGKEEGEVQGGWNDAEGRHRRCKMKKGNAAAAAEPPAKDPPPEAPASEEPPAEPVGGEITPTSPKEPKPEEENSTGLSLHVNFEKFPELLEKLDDEAEENLREPDKQLLAILKERYGKGLGGVE